MEMENNNINVTPTTETPSNPIVSSPQPTQSHKKLVLIILAFVFLIIACSVGVYAFLSSKQDRVSLTKLPQQQETDLNGCTLAKQSATGSVIKPIETKFNTSTQAIDTYPDKKQKLTARVLNVAPFIIEVYDIQPSPDYIFDAYGVQEDMFVDISEKNKLSQLKFNDIITADLYGFTYASVELAFSSAIKNIQKVNKINSTSRNPFANRSGTLIRYAPSNTNSNGFLLIFNDGKVFYRDNNNNTFTDKTLTSSEFNQILKSFSSANFDKISTDYEVSLSNPSLLLICNRYQKVSLTANATNLKPVLTELDKVLESYSSNAKHKLTYNKRFIIKDWEYASIVPLDQSDVVTFKQQNKERLSKMKPSAELLKEVEEFDTYYRYNGKIYGIYFGNCVDGTTGTWACFGAEELKNQTTGGKRYNLWPTELSVKLKDASPDGISISSEEYKSHKDFYDKLLTWDDNLLFLESNYLYQRISVSLY